MGEPTLIALDAGTTSVRAVLYDRELRALAQASRTFPQHFPSPGRVEHRAEEILRAADEALAELAGHPRARDALALGITNQRETIFALDLERGAALEPGIVWQDRRTARRCAALREAGHAEEVARRTGLVLDPYFSATKIEWMLAERPEVAARAAAGQVRFVTVDALLVHHLSGGATCATDPTNASRTLLFDVEERRWSRSLGGLFGVEPGWLPEVRGSTASFGEVRLAGLGGLAIHGVAGDQQAALFGQGAFDAGGAKLTYGTGCFLLVQAGARRPAPSAALLTTLGVDRAGATSWVLEGSVFAGGSIVQWLRDGLGILGSAAESEALARSVPDCAGVVLVPAFTGLGAPYWDPDARAALLGMTRGTSRAHLARAALEAIALQCAELVECVRADAGLALGELRADGGASANDLLLQLQADLAGLTVVRPSDVETTALGAARLAGLGAGLWSDPEEPAGPRALGGRFLPALDAEERARRLARWRRAVARVRGSLD